MLADMRRGHQSNRNPADCTKQFTLHEDNAQALE